VRAAGRELLLSTLDLREVVAPSPVAPLPGRPRGIQGVVIHQGEFLPVLAWEDLPGGEAASAPPVALAVLRPRLGIPLERMMGMVDEWPADWQEPGEDDPTRSWSGAAVLIDGAEVRLLDAERLISLLRRFRNDR
jgi:chemotaxis signal transduction protein